jgi:hypothetical protein
MQNLIDAAEKASGILANANASEAELVDAAESLREALADTGKYGKTFIAGALKSALESIEVELKASRPLVGKSGASTTVAPDGGVWTKGVPKEPGAYWFVVPFVERWYEAAVFLGRYREFPFDTGAALDRYGHATESELAEFWHRPCHVPAIPSAIALRSRSRGQLNRSLESNEVLAFRDGELDI